MTKPQENSQENFVLQEEQINIVQHYKKVNITQFTKNLGILIFDNQINENLINQFSEHDIIRLSDYMDCYKEPWFIEQKYFDLKMANLTIKENNSIENDKKLKNKFLSPLKISAILSSTKSILPFHKIIPSSLDFTYPFIYGHISTITEETDGIWIDELIERISSCERIDYDIIYNENFDNIENFDHDLSSKIRTSATLQVQSRENPPNITLYPSTKTHLQLLSTIKEKSTLRSLQKFMQHAKKCAMSLGSNELVFFPVNETSSIDKKKKNKSNKKLSKKESIISENEERMLKIKTEKDKQFLKSFLSKYLRSTDSQKKYFLESIQIDTYSFLIRKRITLLRIEYYSSVWKYESRKERPDDSKMVDLYINCLYFIEEIMLNRDTTKYSVSKQEKEYVYGIMKEIGFIATLEELESKIKKKENVNSENQGENIKSEDKEWKVSDIDVYFQLKHAGDKLKRSLNSVRDPRSSFLLDAWQKKTLDLIDQEKSLIISAPTSSGKTFITYYTINKTRNNLSIQETNSDKRKPGNQSFVPRKRVLFVVPEKALVNQLAFDIINKFDSLKYGLILKEYTHDEDADIILSVPEMVEGILEKWEIADSIEQEIVSKKTSANIARSKNINQENKANNGVILIIDEIHKLNSPEMSSFIERAIHKHTGQLICLSATMGEDKRIYHWLNELKKGIELVEHVERYCELRKFYWSGNKNKKMGLISPLVHLREEDFYIQEESDKNNTSPGQDKLDNDSVYELMHPKDIPYSLKSITLLPEDVLALYYAIFTVATQPNMIKNSTNSKQLKKDVKKLKFSNWFKSNIVTKMDVKLYYFDLIRIIIRNNIAGKVLELMNQETFNMFGKNITKETPLQENEEIMNQNIENKSISIGCNSDLNEIVDLINNLQENDMLPVIVFGMSSEQLTTLSYKLYEYIVKKQTLNENVDRKREEKMRNLKKFTEKKTANKDDWIEQSMLLDELESVVHLQEDYSIEKISANEIDNLVSDVKTTSLYKSMLHYGIGVHHRGLNKKYREVVEMMFRSKNLGVVFSTETLALGINMPCRSVVICGENAQSENSENGISKKIQHGAQYLTCLDKISLIQMSGRAGRRGHDTIGNVIYLGISPDNLIRLSQASESIEKSYSLDVYSALWFGKNYLESALINPFTYISDVSGNSIKDEKFSQIFDDFSEKIFKNAKEHEKDISISDDTVSLEDLKQLLEKSPIRYQYLNLVSLLFNYGFILPCTFKRNNKELVSFTRSTWGEVLIKNEIIDPLLFVILIRSKLIPFSELTNRDFVNLISHFVGVKTLDVLTVVQTKKTDDEVDMTENLQEIENTNPSIMEDTELFLQPLPVKITDFIDTIFKDYPLKNPLIKLSSFLTFNTQRKCNYIFDFYCNGYGSFSRKFSKPNTSEDKNKELWAGLSISESELWKSVDSLCKLLESLIDILEGDEKRLVRDVWDIMRVKLKGIDA